MPKPRLRFEASALAGPAAAEVEGTSFLWDLDEVEVRSTDVPRPCSSSMVLFFQDRRGMLVRNNAAIFRTAASLHGIGRRSDRLEA